MIDEKPGTLDPKEYNVAGGTNPWLKPHPWDANRPKLPSCRGFWKRVIALNLSDNLERSLDDTVGNLRSEWRDIEPNYGSKDYINMANGGYGISIRHMRAYMYPEWTDEMFQIVCDFLGWDWKNV